MVQDALADAYQILSAENTMIPQSNVRVEGTDATTLLNLLGDLDDHDDVQNVYANFDMDDELLEEAE